MLEFRIDIWAGDIHLGVVSTWLVFKSKDCIKSLRKKECIWRWWQRTEPKATQCEKIGKRKETYKGDWKASNGTGIKKKKRELIGQWTKYFKKEQLNCKILLIGGERWGLRINHWVWQYGCHQRLYKSYLVEWWCLGFCMTQKLSGMISLLLDQGPLFE